jgi:hypothetical protein
MPQTTYPSAPILNRIEGIDPNVAADKLGVTPRTIKRWKAGGGLRERIADQVATRLGDHIAHIWPDEYRDATRGDC